MINGVPIDRRDMPRWLLYAAVFIAGVTTLGIELSTSRLIGAILGTSDIVWAAVITMVLIYLTVGYYVGGKWADRSPNARTFFQLLAWTAFSAGLLPVLVRPLMLKLATLFALADLDLALMVLASVGVMLLFAVPVTLLGCVSPFAVRLAVTDRNSAGHVAGQVYAVSTLGSIIGTFGPVFVLIPAIGTAWTFVAFAMPLLVVALIGLYWVRPRLLVGYAGLPLALMVVMWLGVQGPIRPAPAGTTLLYEIETPYNYVQVVEVNEGVVVSRQPPGTRFLLLNEGQGVHSVYHPEQLQTSATWDMFLVAPYFNPVPYESAKIDRIAIVGLAAGTIAQQYTAVYGPVHIDGIEIDPGIVDAGREYFGMTMPNLNVMVEEGRYGLARLGGDYDLVAIDAYRVPYIPWHLTTVEFFEDIREQLAPDGVVMINVGRAASDRRFVDAMTSTMLEVYPSVHAIDVPFSFNTMLVGTQMWTDRQNLAGNSEQIPDGSHPLLVDTLLLAYESIVDTNPSGVVFTDDRAPVETMINEMILDFVLGTENLDG